MKSTGVIRNPVPEPPRAWGPGIEVVYPDPEALTAGLPESSESGYGVAAPAAASLGRLIAFPAGKRRA
jgi:hypothetical protein